MFSEVSALHIKNYFFGKLMQWCSFTAEQNVSSLCLKARSWKCYIIVRKNLVALGRENDGLPHGMKRERDSKNSSHLYPSPISISARQLDQIQNPKKNLGLKCRFKLYSFDGVTPISSLRQ